MNAICQVFTDGTVEIKEDVVSILGGINICAIAGRGEARNYASTWYWKKEDIGKNQVNIYISKGLDSKEVLEQLTPIFEGVTSTKDLVGKTFKVDRVKNN